MSSDWVKKVKFSDAELSFEFVKNQFIKVQNP